VDLQMLAVLAATVEDLVHSDTVELLRKAYEVLGFSVDTPLANAEQEELVIKTYMLYFLLPWAQEDLRNGTAIVRWLPEAPEAYPGWESTLLWVKDLKSTIRYKDSIGHDPFMSGDLHFRSFSSMTQLVEQIIDGIGVFQNVECKMMKNKLLDMQDSDRNDGRVPLGKFYADFLAEREFWFTESPEYLRNLGALDDSDPNRLSVIVPNLVYGRSNCLATSSGFHSLCCVNQCDVLMESVESSIGSPATSPAALVELVSSLSSDTIVAPRNLSGSLRQKLDRIADQHAGHVPLHSRLFAQWMHHAFPNECPFPHLSGVEAPLTHDEWSDQLKKDSQASVEVMQRFVNATNSTTDASTADTSSPSVFDEPALLWTDEEELVTELAFEQWAVQPGRHLNVLRFVAMCVAVVATIATLFDSLRSSAFLARPAELKGLPGRSRWSTFFGHANGRTVAQSEWI